MLLDIDGLSEPWTDDEFDSEEYADLPLVTIRRRLSDEAIAAVLQAKFGEGGVVLPASGAAPDAVNDQDQEREDPRVVADYDSFREALVAHFSYRWSLDRDDANAIFWPRSNSYRSDSLPL